MAAQAGEDIDFMLTACSHHTESLGCPAEPLSPLDTWETVWDLP